MSGPNRRLGRGLAALIPDDVMSSAPDAGDARKGKVISVPLGEVRPNPEQPRTEFNKVALEELAASLRRHGVLSPLIVRPDKSGGYVLIAGERRLRAAGLAGLAEVPVLVRDDAESAEVQLELALVENLQREDLDAIESARGYQRLQQAFGYTQEEVARKVGKDRATVANALRLLRLPDFALKLVQEGRLTAGHAKALVPVEEHDVLREIISQVLARGLSVRATEKLVKARRAVKKTVRTRRELAPALRHLSQELSRRMSTAVEIKPKSRGNGGRVVIDYYTGEDLERIIGFLRDASDD